MEHDDDKTRTHTVLTSGTEVAHYRIIDKIGAGGMGEVYLALDTELTRKVALKFLPSHLCQDDECRARFKREAQAAAKLDHPNIAGIYEVGEYQNRPYYAMQLIEGQSLGEVIAGKDLPIDRILEITIQICGGLQAAHDKGIIHRDIKPSNVLIDGHGRVRVVDFGLATIRGAENLTKTGSTLGTIGYMSPEQIEVKDTDRRSDLFSLGVVLYELITGRSPFKRDTEAATLNAILNDIPEPLSRYKSGVADELQRIVSKLLQKDPEIRYQTAAGVVSDLRLLKQDSDSSIPSGARWKSSRPVSRYLIPVLVVAVLVALLILKPFKFEIDSTDNAVAAENRLAVIYFDNLVDPGDSLRLGKIAANLLITDLSESDYMQVVSGQRLFDIMKQMGIEDRQQLTGNKAAQVAEKAGAQNMLLGSIIRTSPSIVLTSQIVDVATGDVLASQRIDGGPEDDIFPLIDRLTIEIKKDMALPTAAVDEEDPPIADVTTQSREAYSHYLQGREYGYKLYEQEAEACYRKAVEIDSTFLMAYLALLDEPGHPEYDSLWAIILRYADKASTRERLNIQINQAINHDLDINKALELVKKLVDHYPDDRDAMFIRAGAEFTVSGNNQNTIQLYERILDLDPNNAWAYNMLAYLYERVGDFEKSQWAVNKYLELAPNEANPYDTRGDMYAYNGRLKEAIQSYSEAVSIRARNTNSLSKLGHMHLYLQDYDKAEEFFKMLASDDDEGTRFRGRRLLTKIPESQGKLEEALRKKALVIEMLEMESGESSWPLLTAMKDYAYLARFYSPNSDAADDMVRRARTIMHVAPRSITWLRENIILSGLELSLLSISGQRQAADSLRHSIYNSYDTSMAEIFRSWWFSEGLSELHVGNPQKAADIFLRLLQIKPTFAYKYYLARSYLEANRLGDAVEMFEQAMPRYDDTRWPIESALCHYYAGIAYEKSGWNRKAMNQYEQFLDIWKDVDPGIKEVEDAKQRLAHLESLS